MATQTFDPSEAYVFFQFALKADGLTANGFFVHTPAHSVQRKIGNQTMLFTYPAVSGYAMHITAPEVADLTASGKAVWDFDGGKARFTFSTPDGSTLCNVAYYLDENGLPLVDVESATLQINQMGLTPSANGGYANFDFTVPVPVEQVQQSK